MKHKVLLGLATALLITACVSGSAVPAKASAPTPEEIATGILGHAPTGLAATIVDRGYVSVANDSAFPRASWIDRNGVLKGFDVDVAGRVGEILGLNVHFTNPSWEDVLSGLQQGSFDVSIGSMSITPERERVVAFTAPYYYNETQVFVKRRGPQITGIRDLFGKTVAINGQSIYYKRLADHPRIRLKSCRSDYAALLALRRGDVRFAVVDALVGLKAIRYGRPIEFSGRPIFYTPLAIAIKQDEADWRALLNYTVQSMHHGGSLSTMSRKWFFGLDLTGKQ